MLVDQCEILIQLFMKSVIQLCVKIKLETYACSTEFFLCLDECFRNLMYDDEVLRTHLYGNPRNIKRIFNVISITAYVIKAIQARVSLPLLKLPKHIVDCALHLL